MRRNNFPALAAAPQIEFSSERRRWEEYLAKIVDELPAPRAIALSPHAQTIILAAEQRDAAAAIMAQPGLSEAGFWGVRAVLNQCQLFEEAATGFAVVSARAAPDRPKVATATTAARVAIATRRRRHWCAPFTCICARCASIASGGYAA